MKRLLLLFLLFPSLASASVWHATDGNVDVALLNPTPDPLVVALTDSDCQDAAGCVRVLLNWDAWLSAPVALDKIYFTDVDPVAGGGVAVGTDNTGVDDTIVTPTGEFKLWGLVNPIDSIWQEFDSGIEAGTDAHFISIQASNYLLVDAAVSGVPIGATSWLFGSGLLGLAGVARRRET